MIKIKEEDEKISNKEETEINKGKKLKKVVTKKSAIALIIIFAIILLGIYIIANREEIITNIKGKSEQIEELGEEKISYETYKLEGNSGTALIKFNNENGIKQIECPHNEGEEGRIIYPGGKTYFAIDYQMEDRNKYIFKVTDEDGAEEDLTIDYEIPRIKGNYVEVNGMYVNEPDVTTGFKKDRTRYMYLNDQEKLVPGDWLTGEEPENWYDYKEKKWANIYVEDGGVDSYYVWIPRYVYKLDSQTQRSEIKFINTYNEYKDPEKEEIETFEELQAEGYQLPEAFSWAGGEYGVQTIIPGYWISKYELSELGANFIIDFSLSADEKNLYAKNIKTSTTAEIAKYTYAINGEIVHTVENKEPVNYEFENIGTGVKVINVTALDKDGKIIGSMTKELEPTEVNEPELSKFDQNTTFILRILGRARK